VSKISTGSPGYYLGTPGRWIVAGFVDPGQTPETPVGEFLASDDDGEPSVAEHDEVTPSVTYRTSRASLVGRNGKGKNPVFDQRKG
jgi:hypothetical protein